MPEFSSISASLELIFTAPLDAMLMPPLRFAIASIRHYAITHCHYFFDYYAATLRLLLR